MTQADLAKTMSYDQSYISAVEKGRKNPTGHKFIHALARGLQLPPGKVEWLRSYALLNHAPDVISSKTDSTKSPPVPSVLTEQSASYSTHDAIPAKRMAVGMEGKEILRAFGPPDVIIETDPVKWIYHAYHTMLLLDRGGRVAQVTDAPAQRRRMTLADLKTALKEVFGKEAITRDALNDLAIEEGLTEEQAKKLLNGFQPLLNGNHT